MEKEKKKFVIVGSDGSRLSLGEETTSEAVRLAQQAKHRDVDARLVEIHPEYGGVTVAF